LCAVKKEAHELPVAPGTRHSPHNPLLKEIRRAAARGGLTSDGLCLAEGLHLLEEALRSGWRLAAIVATENAISAAAGVAKIR